MRSIPTLARFLLPLGAAVVLTVSLANRGTSQAAGGIVSVQPGSQVAHVGDTVSVDLGVTGTSNLASWEFWLKWDPAILSFDAFENGDFLASSGRSPACILPVVDASAGTVHLGCNSSGPNLDGTPTAGAAGDGVLAHVRFKANAVGDSNLEFTKAQLSDPISTDSCCIPGVNEGAVRVTESQDAPLPATPTPNPAKLQPTVVSHLPADSLTLDRGAQATAAAGGVPVAASGGSSGGATSSGGSTSSGVTGDVSGIGSGSGSTGGTGIPHAGDGTVVRTRSTLVDVLAGVLASAGLLCVAVSARSWRRSRR